MYKDNTCNFFGQNIAAFHIHISTLFPYFSHLCSLSRSTHCRVKCINQILHAKDLMNYSRFIVGSFNHSLLHFSIFLNNFCILFHELQIFNGVLVINHMICSAVAIRSNVFTLRKTLFLLITHDVLEHTMHSAARIDSCRVVWCLWCLFS